MDTLREMFTSRQFFTSLSFSAFRADKSTKTNVEHIDSIDWNKLADFESKEEVFIVSKSSEIRPISIGKKSPSTLQRKRVIRPKPLSTSITSCFEEVYSPNNRKHANDAWVEVMDTKSGRIYYENG
jgi:hypothetical protein